MSDAALDQAPFSPFALDPKAKILTQMGALDKARKVAELAMRMGRPGPFRHHVASTLAIIDCRADQPQAAWATASLLLRSGGSIRAALCHILPGLIATGDQPLACELVRRYDLRGPFDTVFPALSTAQQSALTLLVQTAHMQADAPAQNLSASQLIAGI